MIIVEGTDLVGKTTFCHKVIAELTKRSMPYTYQHLSRLPESWDMYWSYIDKFTENAVCDRFHDSELAYCYGRGDETRLTPDCYDMLNSKLLSMGTFKVLILPDNAKVLRERHAARAEEEMYNADLVVKVNEWFRANISRFHYVIQCEQFPSDVQVLNVVGAYVKHRTLVDKIKRHRNERL